MTSFQSQGRCYNSYHAHPWWYSLKTCEAKLGRTSPNRKESLQHRGGFEDTSPAVGTTNLNLRRGWTTRRVELVHLSPCIPQLHQHTLLRHTRRVEENTPHTAPEPSITTSSCDGSVLCLQLVWWPLTNGNMASAIKKLDFKFYSILTGLYWNSHCSWWLCIGQWDTRS